MGGKNKGQDPQTTTQTPYLSGQVGRMGQAADAWFNKAQATPTYAGTSDISQSAFDTARGAFPQTTQMLQSTVAGDYLGANNPYLRDVVDRAQDSAMGRVNATFGGAGRTGSGLHQQALASSMGDIAAGIYAPAYEAERGRQMQATGMLPGVMQSQLGFGGALEARDLERQLAPYTDIQRYAALVNSPSGGSTTVPGMEGRNPLAGAFGGAMAGGQAFGPWGALAGGILGGTGVI